MGGRLQIRDWPSSDAALGGVASPVAATEPPSITAAAGVASPAAAVEAPVEAGPAGPAPGAEPAVEAGPAGPAPGAEPAVEAGPAGSEPSPSQVRSGHWREDKIGLLMTMTSEESAVDPCPTIPETFVNPLRILKLARELKKGCTPGADAVADPAETEGENPLEGPEYTPPAVRVRSMVATRHENESLGEILACGGVCAGVLRGAAQGVPGRWSRKQLDGPQAVVQRFRGDPGFHPRVVVCFCRSDGGAWVCYGMGGVCGAGFAGSGRGAWRQ